MTRNIQLISRTEPDVDLDLMVLECNKRESQTVVTAEIELKRNVHSVSWFQESILRNVPAEGADGSEFWNITDHLGIPVFLSDRVRKFVPDVHPVTVLLVDLRSSNFKFDFIENSVSNTSDPSEFNMSETCEITIVCDFRKCNFGENLCNQVTVT